MATIYDVAKRAGVSTATVSAVLNKTAYVSPALKKKVQEAVRELDYTINHMARSLQTRSSRSVGMLIPGSGGPDPFFGQVVRGVEDVLRKKGFALLLGHTYNQVEEQSRYLEAFRARLVDGFLLFQAPGEDAALRRILQDKKPIVFVGRIPEDTAADVVATDIAKGTYLAVSHLIAKGHRRIGLTTVKSSMSVAKFRVEGWRKALAEHGLASDDSCVAVGRFSSETGCSAAAQFLKLKDRPTAIFADNLTHTSGILRTLKESGLRVPDDMEVMSSDDAEWLDVIQPAISAVIQPSYDLGTKSAELLLKRLRYPNRKHEMILLDPKLKIRD